MAAVTRVGPGAYRVEVDGVSRIVYVAGSAEDRWAFCDGRLYRRGGPTRRSGRRVSKGTRVAQTLSSPMPATIVKVLVEPGRTVQKGDTLVVAEAMKMELPIRAPSDGVVAAVLCRQGELVEADQPLVELR